MMDGNPGFQNGANLGRVGKYADMVDNRKCLLLYGEWVKRNLSEILTQPIGPMWWEFGAEENEKLLLMVSLPKAKIEAVRSTLPIRL